MTIKVGDTLYSFVSHPRQFEDKWKQHKIIGETKVSWLIEPEWSPCKVNKKTMSTVRDPIGPMFFTKQGMEDRKFCDEYALAISSSVSVCKDPEKLRAIAAIVGVEMPLAIGDTLYRQGTYKVVSAIITGETEFDWLLNRINVSKGSLVEGHRDGQDQWFTNEDLK